MSYAPQTLKDLQSFWKAQGGVPLGIVGDASHVNKGVSYHLGKDLLQPDAYSARLPRDKAGLTNAASAIDLGRLHGSLHELWAFSRWFAQQCMDKQPGYEDVREVIFWSTARDRVIGWSALAPTQWINDYGDASHKTHTHISYFRDSEYRDKRGLFRAYPAFIPVTPPPLPEEDMILSQNLPGYTTTVKKTANIRTAPKLNATIIRVVDIPENWTLHGAVKGDVDGGSDQWYVRWNADRWEYTAASNLLTVPLAPASQVELAAEKAKVAAATTSLAAAKTDLAACNLKVTNAKAALA